MRWIVAECMQETNTFSPIPTTLDTFHAGYVYPGDEMIERLKGSKSQVGAFVDVARERDVELIPLFAATACSGGRVTREAFDTFVEMLTSGIDRAGEFDGVLLSLHGAMAAEGEDDAEGHMLEAVRERVGPAIPVVCTLDLHGHVTERMIGAADVIVGYKTYPHVDMYETGRHGAETLYRLIAENLKAHTAIVKAPMILPADTQSTFEGPMAEVMQVVLEIESRPDVLVASAYPVQPWLDVPGAAFTALVTTTQGRAEAKADAERIAAAAWERRERFFVKSMSVGEAIDYACAREGGPYVFGDSGDAPSSGSPGDNTTILATLLEKGVNDPAMLLLVDPEAVKTCAAAGVGRDVTVSVGGKVDREHCKPVTVTGRVRALTDGAFTFTGPGFTDVEYHMGLTAMLQIGSISLMLISIPVFMWDAAIYRSAGLDPAAAKLVFVKSPNAFRAFYEPIAKEMHTVASPGVSSIDLLALTYTRIDRPMFPFDPDAAFEIAL